jgi:hypothetical protein
MADILHCWDRSRRVTENQMVQGELWPGASHTCMLHLARSLLHMQMPRPTAHQIIDTHVHTVHTGYLSAILVAFLCSVLSLASLQPLRCLQLQHFHHWLITSVGKRAYCIRLEHGEPVKILSQFFINVQEGLACHNNRFGEMHVVLGAE